MSSSQVNSSDRRDSRAVFSCENIAGGREREKERERVWGEEKCSKYLSILVFNYELFYKIIMQ